jgi:ABC-type multidrug transport system ATPase subunit
VYERANKSKHQQLISGVNVVAYWVSTYVWDVVLFLIPALLCIIVIAIYDISELLNDGFGALILGLILYATSITPFTYVISFLFQSHTEAQNTMLIVYIFTGAILLIVSVVLFIIESTRDVNNHLRYVYRLLPNYCFGELLSNVIIRSAQVVWGRPRDAFDMDIAGYPLVFMAWESVFYFLCVLGIEFVLRRPDIMSIFFPTPQVTDPPSEEDEDVVAEKQRVAALDGTKDKDVVVVKGLRKVYPTRLGAPPKVAVREVWLGVHEGECFGLLGINGAGKTTTLKMLTADEIPTSGTAVIDGLDVATQQNDIRHRMGYCPQFDAIIETLTAREQLKLYARIKGLPPQVIDEYVARLIIQLGLSEYADKPCGGYSGGNKRKLSLGISLIGNPRVMFLDEPSTGMDPGARRFMWDLISSSMAGRSVILTTHSMEECEALCQRIGIMVGGRMRCLGTASHLKERYGYGYQLDVNTGVHPTDKVLAFVHERFPGAKILERQQQNIKFRVPRQGTTLADLFEMIESNKARLDVSEYSVSETTLEQIFIHFARQQEEELGQLDAFAEDSFAGARPELAAGGTGAAAPPAKDTELVQVGAAPRGPVERLIAVADRSLPAGEDGAVKQDGAAGAPAAPSAGAEP